MSKQKASEIEAIEMAADDRRRNRNDGFSMAAIRDRGWVHLENGFMMRWNAPTIELEEGEFQDNPIPKGYFLLNFQGKNQLFDAEEFRKWLRWA